ncbi:MAG: hypothetical protein WD205_10100, partial [Rhodothermales bacterium]
MNTLFGSWRRLVEHRSGPTTLIATLFAGLLLTGCPDFLTSEDDGRILPLKSIDGVRLGDSREQVEMRLGGMRPVNPILSRTLSDPKL